MSERRIHLVTDDGTQIDVTLRPGVTKVTLEVTERPASAAGSSAGTANSAAVSPESPAATPDAGTQIEQRRPASSEGVAP